MANALLKLRQLTVHEPRDDEFTRYVRGKRVVIVGPSRALEGRGRGAEFDGYDVVIRMNGGLFLPDNNPQDYGKRTDVYWANQKFRILWARSNEGAIPEEFLRPELKYFFVLFQQLREKEARFAKRQDVTCAVCGKRMQAGDLREIFIVDEQKDPFAGLPVHTACQLCEGARVNEQERQIQGRVVGHEMLMRIDAQIEPMPVLKSYSLQFRDVTDLLARGQRVQSEDPFDDILLGLHVILDTVRREPAELHVAGFDFYAKLREMKFADKYAPVDASLIYGSGYRSARDSCLTPGHKDDGGNQQGILRNLYEALQRADSPLKTKLTLDAVLHDILFNSETVKQKLKKLVRDKQKNRSTKN